MTGTEILRASTVCNMCNHYGGWSALGGDITITCTITGTCLDALSKKPLTILQPG